MIFVANDISAFKIIFLVELSIPRNTELLFGKFFGKIFNKI